MTREGNRKTVEGGERKRSQRQQRQRFDILLLIAHEQQQEDVIDRLQMRQGRMAREQGPTFW
jgi:hypothetical protein